jgi:hypothetical protein
MFVGRYRHLPQKSEISVSLKNLISLIPAALSLGVLSDIDQRFWHHLSFCDIQMVSVKTEKL